MGVGYSHTHAVFECVVTANANGRSERAYNNWFLKSLPNGYFVGDALAKMLSAQMHILFDRGPSFVHSYAKFNSSYEYEGVLGRLEVYVPPGIAEIQPVSYTLYGTKFKVTFKKVVFVTED
jgi:hypothetical protein